MEKCMFLHTFFAAQKSLRVVFSRNSNHDRLGELSNIFINRTVKFSSKHPADATAQCGDNHAHTLTHTGIHSTHKT